MAHDFKLLIRTAAIGVAILSYWLTASLQAAVPQTVQLAWDPSPDAAVVGYNIYYGPASRDYTNRVSVGAITTASISNLVGGVTYYFVATAHDNAGLESDPSNEIFYTPPVIGSNQPPQISAINPQTIQINSSTPPIAFTISDVETPAANLALSARSSNLGLLSTNQIVFAGNNSNRTVALTPATGQTGAVTVTIYVSDGAASNQTAFVLNVLPLPVTNSVVVAAGIYHGLFFEPDAVQHPSSGGFKISLTTKRTYSGKLQLGAGKYAFSGSVGPTGKVNQSIPRKDGPPLTLEMDFAEVADQVVGRITDGAWEALLSGDRAVFHAQTNPARQAGSYTLVLPGLDQPGIPAGHGHATVRVNTAGNVRLAGVLADGTKVTQSAGLSKNGLWPVYVALYSGKGSLTSWLAFTNQPSSDLSGRLAWIKTGGYLSPYYPTGFTNELIALGSIYRPPLTSLAKVLALDAAQITFSGGQLNSDFFNAITIGPGSQLLNWHSNRLTLKFVAATGLFKGSVVNPANQSTLNFKGVVLQKMNRGYGFLLLTNQSSSVLVHTP